jgi:hypothetical protein
VWYNIDRSTTPQEGIMKTRIIAILIAVLSMLLGGCVTTGVRTSATIYTAPAHAHHHGVGSKAVVSTTTTVETERHAGAVVKKTTVVVRKQPGYGSTGPVRGYGPYCDEYDPRAPCYWKRHIR